MENKCIYMCFSFHFDFLLSATLTENSEGFKTSRKYLVGKSEITFSDSFTKCTSYMAMKCGEGEAGRKERLKAHHCHLHRHHGCDETILIPKKKKKKKAGNVVMNRVSKIDYDDSLAIYFPWVKKGSEVKK